MHVRNLNFRFKLSTAGSNAASVRRFFFLKWATPWEKQSGAIEPLISKEMFVAPSWKDVPERLAKDPSLLMEIMGSIPGMLERKGVGQLSYDAVSDERGHAAVHSLPIEYGANANKEAKDPSLFFSAVLGSFPSGMVILPSDAGIPYLKATNKDEFLKSNGKEIAQVRKDLANGKIKSFEGFFAILGNGSVVRCVQHELNERPDGGVMHFVHMMTTSLHVFDGSFCWGAQWHPSRPTEITALGFQIGKHPWYDLDGMNRRAGVGLFYYNNMAALEVAKQRSKGLPVIQGDRSIFEDARLRALGGVLAAMDCFASIPQEMRSAYGAPGTCAEIVDIQHLELIMEGRLDEVPLVAVANEPGIEIDGYAWFKADDLPSTVDQSSQGEARRALTERMKDLLTQSTWGSIRQDVLDLANARLGRDFKEKAGSELLEALVGDPVTLHEINKIIGEYLLDPILPDTLDSISYLNLTDAQLSHIEWNLKKDFHANFAGKVASPEGALHSALQLDILEKQVAVMDKPTIANALQAASHRAKELAHDIAELRDKRAGATADALHDIETRLREHEDALALTLEKEARYKEQVHSLDEYATLKEHHTEEMSRKAQEFFSHRE